MNRIATIAAALLLSAAGVSAQTVPASALQLNCRSSAPLSSATDARVYYKCSDHKVYISKQGAAFTEFGAAAVPTGTGFYHVTSGVMDGASVGETGTGLVVREINPSIDAPSISSPTFTGSVSMGALSLTDTFLQSTSSIPAGEIFRVEDSASNAFVSFDRFFEVAGTSYFLAEDNAATDPVVSISQISGQSATVHALEIEDDSFTPKASIDFNGDASLHDLTVNTCTGCGAPVSTTVTTNTAQTITATKTFQGADDQIHVDATTGNYGLIHFLDNGTDKFYTGLFPDSTWRIGTAGGSPFWIDFSTLAVRLYNLDLHPHDAPAANTKTFNLRNASDVSVASIDYEGDAIVHDLTLTGSLQTAIAESSVTNLTTDLAAKVAANGAISGATKTKITYDAKGLVTAGADATLASADYANQGTAMTLLHGNASGNPSWGAVSLTADVSGVLPKANMAATTVHTDQANTYTSASQNFAAGTGTATYKPEGVIHANVTAVGTTSGTGEEILWTYTLPGGTLANDGDVLVVEVNCVPAANGNTKTQRLYWNGVTAITRAAADNQAPWRWTMIVTRLTATTQYVWAEGRTGSSTVGINPIVSGSATLSGNVVIKFTGQDTSASANDLTFKTAKVIYQPAP